MFIFTKQMKRIIYFGSITVLFSLIHYNFYVDPDLIQERTFKNSKNLKQLVNKQSKNTYHIKISINTATKEQLILIPGIGVKTAQKIIQYREKHVFVLLNDLLNIKGIGLKKLEKMKRHISL